MMKANARMPACGPKDQQAILDAVGNMRGSDRTAAERLVREATPRGLCLAMHGMRRWYTYNSWNAAKKVLAVKGPLSAVMDLTPPVGAFRGFKVDRNDPLASLQEGEVIDLPVQRNGGCSAWTTKRETADKFSGSPRGKVGLVVQLVDNNVDTFLAPPDRSAAWFNQLYDATMGGGSHRRSESEVAVYAPSVKVKVVKVKGSGRATTRKKGSWQRLTGTKGVAFAAEVDNVIARAKAGKVPGAKVYDLPPLPPTASRTRKATRRRAQRTPSVLLSLTALSVGAMSSDRLDSLVTVRPLGPRVTPTVVGTVLTLLGAVVVDRVYHRRDVAVPLAALGVGLGARAITRKSQV